MFLSKNMATVTLGQAKAKFSWPAQKQKSIPIISSNDHALTNL